MKIKHRTRPPVSGGVLAATADRHEYLERTNSLFSAFAQRTDVTVTSG
jgi:hypothetical protein